MEPVEYRAEIYDVFAGTGGDVESRVARALEIGTEYLDLPIGFFTRIDEGVQRIVTATGDHALIRPGESCPLDSAYCQRTIEIEGTLAVQDARASDEISRAAVETFDLGTYVGAKVVVDGGTYGTVCFADGDQRATAFTDAEEMFVELVARLAGQALERREHERELEAEAERARAEKQRFRAIAETSYDIIFRVGPDAEFTYVSAAVERVLGYDPAELVGVPFAEIMCQEAMDDALRAYQRTMAGETVENLELAFRDSGGERVLVEVNAVPLTDGGSVVGAQGVGRDVTARRERERELRMKNRAMDDADVGIVIADATQPDDPVIYANAGLERLTGYSVSEVLDRELWTVLGNDDGGATDSLRERLAAGTSASTELVNYRKEGTPFWNQIRINPIADESGEVTHYLGFGTDVTGRKRREQLIRILNRVLRHNLRNDMSVILGCEAMIREQSTGDVAALADRIEETASDLLDLSEQAREIERYARDERAPTRLDPAAVLGTVADDYRGKFPRATVDVTVRTDRDVCAGPELERAVSELVGNALKHGGGSEARVEIEATEDGEWIELAVGDDGPGIDEMEATVLARGEETALEHGSGLGLWLVNWIVTRYGGSFQIRPLETGGTLATVRLPAVGPDTTVEEAARKPTVLFQ